MKKLNKFLFALGSVASLASLPLIAAKCGGTKEESKPEANKNPKDPNPGNKDPNTKNKINLSSLESSVVDKIKKSIKNNNVEQAEILDILKEVKGLETLRFGDFKTLDFKDFKLTIEANTSSSLIEGKFEFSEEIKKEENAKLKTELNMFLKEKLVANVKVKRADLIDSLDFDNVKTKADLYDVKEEIKDFINDYYSVFREKLNVLSRNVDFNFKEVSEDELRLFIPEEWLLEIEKETKQEDKHKVFEQLLLNTQVIKEALQAQYQEQTKEVEKLFNTTLK
ncbi:variable surface lipoprotein [Metamycoplasma auris]|uniref:Uncharacterized protein n=1 Tax=Metamycoplasma auris TaxID=51363 RepID=A0A2W7G915_9BACT|nr:variable surface lipoprotein [Metamycoplasma auris]PZW01541.1 hypothetical protein BCF89_10161 [Metamycoplasma auris]